MSKILDEIRQQPEHIRHIFMWLSVAIVFSFVVLVGFRQTEKKIVALLNPEILEQSDTQLADERSPFANIGGYFNELRAGLSGIFYFGDSVKVYENDDLDINKVDSSLLPLSGEKE